MNILITGGAGYLGYSLTQALNELPEINTITVYDNLYRKNYNFFMFGDSLNKVKFIHGDILNEYALRKACDNVDVVFHLAAFVGNPYSFQDNFKYEQVNQFGTGVLYNILKDNAPSKIVFASSGLVYDFQDIATEETVVSSATNYNGYGKSKIEAEKYMNLLQDKAEIYTPRIANIFGFNPMCRYDSVINLFIMNALLYNKIQIMGTGEQKRPFIHLDNVIDYFISLLRNNTTNSIVNLVQNSVSMNDLLQLLMNLQPELEFTYVNANQKFKGYQMISNHYTTNTKFEDDFYRTYHEFKKHFRI